MVDDSIEKSTEGLAGPDHNIVQDGPLCPTSVLSNPSIGRELQGRNIPTEFK